MRSPAISRKSAIRGNRWRFTILGAYKRRWAPYVQAHGPGQGQLPLDRVWPQGLWFLSGSADRNLHIGRKQLFRQWQSSASVGGWLAVQFRGHALDLAGQLAERLGDRL